MEVVLSNRLSMANRARLKWKLLIADSSCTDSQFRMSNGGVHTVQRADVTHETVTISPGARLRAAMLLAIVADALQIVVLPLFVEGAISPADDILDLGVGAALISLLGWHWEFLPSALAKLVPGADLVPFWTMAVANVYRKSKRIATAMEGMRGEPSVREDTRRS